MFALLHSKQFCAQKLFRCRNIKCKSWPFIEVKHKCKQKDNMGTKAQQILLTVGQVEFGGTEK